MQKPKHINGIINTRTINAITEKYDKLIFFYDNIISK